MERKEVAGDANFFFLPLKKASLSLAKGFPRPPPPFSFASQPSPKPWFLHQPSSSSSSLRVTRMENRNNTPLEHGVEKNPEIRSCVLSTISIKLLRIFDIFILNNFFTFQSLSKRSIKKKEINERKRKKKKAIRISWYYDFIEMLMGIHVCAR